FTLLAPFGISLPECERREAAVDRPEDRDVVILFAFPVAWTFQPAANPDQAHDLAVFARARSDLLQPRIDIGARARLRQHQRAILRVRDQSSAAVHEGGGIYRDHRGHVAGISDVSEFRDVT